MVAGAAAAAGVAMPWKSEVTGCTGEPNGCGGCLYMCFCPMCAYANVTSEVLGKGQDDCCMHAVGLTCCSCCFPCVTAFTRTKVYEKYNILDAPVGPAKQSQIEAALSCLCCGCCDMFLCQERNEVFARMDGR